MNIAQNHKNGKQKKNYEQMWLSIKLLQSTYENNRRNKRRKTDFEIQVHAKSHGVREIEGEIIKTTHACLIHQRTIYSALN